MVYVNIKFMFILSIKIKTNGKKMGNNEKNKYIENNETKI